jgi:hypothetical protein
LTRNSATGKGKKIQDRETAFGVRHAKAILFACVAASFLIPYALVSALQTYNDRQWSKSGMSRYEIDEWRRVGIRDVDEAVKWRNGAFEPGLASIWKEEGFTPEEAEPWEKGGFHTGEARIWGSHGFTAHEAKSWKDKDFYYPEAMQWRKEGVTPAEAASRKKKGKRP